MTKAGKEVTYLNSGDWVESLTSLEYNWGTWTLYEYEEADYRQFNKNKLKERDISGEQAIEEWIEISK